METKVPWKIIAIAAVSLILIIMAFMVSGINDAGHRTVIQFPNGTMKVKFEPGWYVSWFGKETVYKDIVTFDFDKGEGSDDPTLDQAGVAVRYQDGGTGTIFGKARFNLPTDEEGMIELHKAFRSNDGIALKLIRPVSEESLNLTAGLMTSEEAYAEQRGTFTDWSREQIERGRFKTELKQVTTEEETGKRVTKNVPVISIGDDGRPVHYASDFAEYGIRVSGYQITDWDFEPKTLDQIATKREATMAIITAIAQAEQAKQEAITAEAKGQAAVMTAQYEKEVEKKRAVVEAEQRKEVAVIEAGQRVEVAAQGLLEAEQKKLAAEEYKQEQVLRGEGDGEYKRLVMEADGALQQKLEAWIAVNGLYAEAIKEQKWVPEVQFGTNGNGTSGNAAQDLLNLFLAKTAQDLSLDMRMGQPTSSQTRRASNN